MFPSNKVSELTYRFFTLDNPLKVKNSTLEVYVSLLGRFDSGKTTLAYYLTNNALPRHLQQITTGFSFFPYVLKYRNHEIKFIDVGCDKSSKILWFFPIMQSNVIFYVTDASLLLQSRERLYQEIKDDFQFMLSFMNPSTPLFLIFNKIDVIPQTAYQFLHEIHEFVSHEFPSIKLFFNYVSAKTGKNISELWKNLVNVL